MSTTNITNEVVRMTFEGDDFEKKIIKSLSALQKLKEKLSFHEVASETEDNMNIITKSLETMANKAETIWARVTDKIKDSISNKLMGALREVQDMTVNQIAAGWTKYAKKTEAVATLVGQGYDMETVNKEMAKLNRYTDETSYQFTEMVNNIGKFTAAGQSLEDANLAMQGIANWAAKSGTNATKASQAMYQLSQAMGKGALKLDDYKSVQNLGMDTQEFRQQAVEAAVALGTLKKNLDGTFTVLDEKGKETKKTFNMSSFTTELTDGLWFTSDVMMKVFSRYASGIENINALLTDDENGVTLASKAIDILEKRNKALRKEFKNLNGTMNMSADEIEASLLKWSKVTEATDAAVKNYMEYNEGVTEEEAKIALNKEYEKSVQEFANTFKVSSEEAKEYIGHFNQYTDKFGLDAYKMAQEAKTFKDALDSVKDAASTQWMNIWENIFGDYAEARKVWTGFANWLYDVLVGWLDDVNGVLKEWATSAFGNREDLMKSFKALGQAIMIVRNAVGKLNKAIFGGFTVEKVQNFVMAFQNGAYKIRDFLKELKASQFLENITKGLSRIRKNFTTVFGAIANSLSSVFGSKVARANPIVVALEKISGAFEKLTKAIRITKSNAEDLNSFLTGLFSVVKAIGKIAWTVISTLVSTLFPSTEGFFKTIKDTENTFFDFIGNLGDKMQQFANKINESGIFEKIQNGITNFTDKLKKHVLPVLGSILGIVWKLVKAIGGAFLWLGQVAFEGLKKIPWDKFVDKLKALKDKLAPVGESLKKVGSAFKEGILGMKNSMSDFNESDERSFFQKILDGLVAGFHAFKEKLGGAWDAFKNVIGEITHSNVWIKLSDFLKKAWSAIKTVFTDYILPVVKYIWSVVSGPIKKVLNMLKEGDIKGILDLIKSSMQIGTLAKIITFLKTFTAFFKDAHLSEIIHSVAGMFNHISRMFDNLSDTAQEAKKAVKAWKNERIASTLLKIVAALALLIGLIFAVSFISPERAKKMGESFVIVLSVALVVIGLLLAVSKAASKGTANLLSVAAVFASIGLCILLISNVIKDLGEQMVTNPDRIGDGILTLIMVIASILISVWVLLKIVGNSKGVLDNKLLGVAAMFAGFGLAMLMISKSIQMISDTYVKYWNHGEGGGMVVLDAILSIILVMVALAGSTWIMSAKKSQAGVMALVALIAVMRFLLIPMLRSVSQETFDVEKALYAIFIPLLGIGTYIVVLSELAAKKHGIRDMISVIVSFAAFMAVISKVFLPSLAEAVATAGGGGTLLVASLSIMLMLASLVGVFKILGNMSWNDILKGAASMAMGVAAVSAALLVMAKAFEMSGNVSGTDFLLMGVGLAASLIALAGAMALIGKFSTSAIVGASALLILAGAVALLTQAIIAFKKYVLGESISDAVGDLTDVELTGNQNGGNKNTKDSSSITQKLKGKVSDSAVKVSNKKKGKTAAEEVSEGYSEGMKTTKSVNLQTKAANTMAKNTQAGLSDYNAEEILKQAGVDTTNLYSEGIESYDAQKILEAAGYSTTNSVSDGMSGKEAQKILEQAGSDATDTIATGMGDNTEATTNGATDLANNLVNGDGTGLNAESVLNLLTQGGEGLTSGLMSGLTTNSDGTVTMGAQDLVSLLTGSKVGLESGSNLGLMSGSGASLVESLCGGMTDTSLVGNFITGACGGLITKIRTTLKPMIVDLVEDIWKPFAFIYQGLTGTDLLGTGLKEKQEKQYQGAKKVEEEAVNQYYDDFINDITLLKDRIHDSLEQLNEMKDEISAETYEEYYNYIVDEAGKSIEAIVASYGIAGDLAWEVIAEKAELRVEYENRLQNVVDEMERLRSKRKNLSEAAERGDLTSGNMEWLDTFNKYYDQFIQYMSDTDDPSIKYEDFVDNIMAVNKKMSDYYGENAPEILQGLEKPFDELISEYKKNGTVLYDMSKDYGEDVAAGFDKGIGNSPKESASNFVDEYKKQFCADPESGGFGIHSPSTWGETMFQWIMQGFADGMAKYMYLMDTPLNQLRAYMAAHISKILLDIHQLLNAESFEFTITPVIDFDNLEYILGGMRFDKNGKMLGETSYKMSKEVGKTTGTGNSGINQYEPTGVLNKLGEILNGINDLNQNGGVTINIKNESDINTTIDKINRYGKMLNGKPFIVKNGNS